MSIHEQIDQLYTLNEAWKQTFICFSNLSNPFLAASFWGFILAHKSQPESQNAWTKTNIHFFAARHFHLSITIDKLSALFASHSTFTKMEEHNFEITNLSAAW